MAQQLLLFGLGGTKMRIHSWQNSRQSQTLLRNLPTFIICLWGLFVSWFSASRQTTDQLARIRWVAAGSPVLRLKLTEQERTSQVKKYEVSIRWDDSAPYVAEFAVKAELMRTLSLAVPPGGLQAALQLEVKIAGLDDNGCILEGGAEHIDRAARVDVGQVNEEILINLKTLPHALCML